MSNPAALTARVLADARRAFGDRMATPVRERYGREAVADLWGDSTRVRMLVPVLTLRRVRNMRAGNTTLLWADSTPVPRGERRGGGA